MARTVGKMDPVDFAIWAIGEALGTNEQYDAHVWGVHSFYQFWNDAPWPVFDHVQAWGEWSDLNTAVRGNWI